MDSETAFRISSESSGSSTALARIIAPARVALPTVQAIHDGYDVYVVEDCGGDVSALAHEKP
jgi:hypothetical protein